MNLRDIRKQTLSKGRIKVWYFIFSFIICILFLAAGGKVVSYTSTDKYWMSCCDDHILDSHVHNIDVINWFMGKHPEKAIGYGGRHRRLTGDQYDFFSVDCDYGNGVSSHSMCRQIDSCANRIGELVMGNDGYTNCMNTIWDLDGNVKWQFDYPKEENGNPTTTVTIPTYVQDHMHLVYAIRTGNYVNEAEQTALSTLTAIMGRTAAYTGRMITWVERLKSDIDLGPSKIEFGQVDMVFETPVPGTPVMIRLIVNYLSYNKNY